jgi:hypothetical protein
MKKILLYLLLLGSSQLAMAQCEFTNFTISPASYTAEDEITITIDVTGTSLAGESDLYIWTWANKEAGAGFSEYLGTTNTEWGNSPAAAKMTQVAGQPNKFTYKLTGIVIYNTSPGQLKHFQFLAKTKNGGKQSCDSKKNAFDPLVFVPTMLRIFPSKVGQNDVVTLFFHQDLAASVNEQRMTPATATVEVFDDAGASAGAPLNLPVTKVGDKLYRVAFIPTRSYTPAAGKKFVRFTYKFNGTVRNENNVEVTVSTGTAEVGLTTMK